jgi:hypothetical protein
MRKSMGRRLKVKDVALPFQQRREGLQKMRRHRLRRVELAEEAAYKTTSAALKYSLNGVMGTISNAGEWPLQAAMRGMLAWPVLRE